MPTPHPACATAPCVAVRATQLSTPCFPILDLPPTEEPRLLYPSCMLVCFRFCPHHPSHSSSPPTPPALSSAHAQALRAFAHTRFPTHIASYTPCGIASAPRFMNSAFCIFWVDCVKVRRGALSANAGPGDTRPHKHGSALNACQAIEQRQAAPAGCSWLGGCSICDHGWLQAPIRFVLGLRGFTGVGRKVVHSHLPASRHWHALRRHFSARPRRPRPQL